MYSLIKSFCFFEVSSSKTAAARASPRLDVEDIFETRVEEVLRGILVGGQLAVT